MAPPSPTDFPLIRTVGLSGMLVTFAEALSEPANRAALAFRAALEQMAWDGVGETSTSLASTFLRFDPLTLPHADLHSRLQTLLDNRNWYDAHMPPGRRLWRVPCVYGTDLAPQLAEAAAAAGLSESDAIARISNTRVRVLTIGFAPGQPYLGPLGPEWNLPRQKDLTPMVPAGALVLAISQLVLFTAPAPTGWRHVGQTVFRCFQVDRPAPFALTPGDEMLFEPVTAQDLERIRRDDPQGLGGASFEGIDP
ncbi:MAG: KipI family sensor histidine kinase inhibitor [Paracoccaceae bacterium]|jgi:KipI family sensor histidine kinase inhibitor